MASSFKFPLYFIILAVVGSILTFSYIFNMRLKNASLARDLKFYQEATALCKEKNKMLVKEAQRKQEEQNNRIKQLDEQNMQKHTALGSLKGKMELLKKEISSKGEEIRELQRLALTHKEEIAELKESILRSKETFKKLYEKASHLMTNHTQLKQEKRHLEKHNKNLQTEVGQHRASGRRVSQKMSRLIKQNELLGRQLDESFKKNEVMQDGIQRKIKESYASRDVLSTRRIPSSQQDEAHVNRKSLKLKSRGNDENFNENAPSTSSSVAASKISPAALQPSISERGVFAKRFSESKPHEQVGNVSAGHDNAPEGTMSKSTADRTRSLIADRRADV